MRLSTILLGGVIILGVWGYREYKSGGDPIGQVEEAVKPVLADVKRGFREGYERELSASRKTDEEAVSYPEDVHKRLELPRLSQDKGQYFVSHKVGDEVNYSLEYDADKHHARWVAFTFDDENSRDRVSRMDTWQWDPQLPERLSTERDFKGSGYSRGHLVASEDRVATKEANKQTFYYSNISPQLKEHNAGIWKRLEEKVRAWGRDSQMRRVLYVAKGGTIAEGQIQDKRLKGKIVIPKYYWMALLLEDHEGNYHAIGFLTEHRDYGKAEGNLQKLMMSIDELEHFTGLDFFHNLPDDLEDEVEAEEPTTRASRRVWW